MRFLPPLMLHGAHRIGEAQLAAHEQAYVQRLGSYPDWPEIADLEPDRACKVAADERPAPGR